MAKFFGPALQGWSIEAWTEQIEVTSSLPRPDPGWRHTDAHGHEHRYKSDTLRWVQDEPDWIDVDGEEYPGDGHYECIQCGEHIQPGSIGPSMYREYMAGMNHVEAIRSDGRRFELNAEQIAQLEQDVSTASGLLDAWFPL
jgi:hypothetical protein